MTLHTIWPRLKSMPSSCAYQTASSTPSSDGSKHESIGAASSMAPLAVVRLDQAEASSPGARLSISNFVELAGTSRLSLAAIYASVEAISQVQQSCSTACAKVENAAFPRGLLLFGAATRRGLIRARAAKKPLSGGDEVEKTAADAPAAAAFHPAVAAMRVADCGERRIRLAGQLHGGRVMEFVTAQPRPGGA